MEGIVFEEALPGLPSVTILRPASVYGPGCTAAMASLATLPPLVKTLGPYYIPFSGGPRTSLVHGDDVARAAVFLLLQPRAYGSAFNVAGNDPLPFGRFLNEAMEAYGLKPLGQGVPYPPSTLLQSILPYNQGEEIFNPLPLKNIDTGMGLERIALVLQQKKDIFATDLFAPILEAVEHLCRFSLSDADESVIRSSRIIADHIRAATFLVSDGVLPSNDGRGYVLRRILRKALVHGRRLGQTGPFVDALLKVVIDNYRDAYPELADNRVFVSRVLGSEEERFLQTLETGIRIFQTEGDRLEKAGERTLPGEVVFRLYDTFGFPPELTEDMAAERGMGVDRPASNDA